KAAGVLLADRRQPVIDAAAQRPGHVDRLGFDPAERAEQRQHARLHPLAIHPGEVELDIVERVGERHLAHARPQHLDFGVVLDDARLAGAGAQGVGGFGGPPMGVHVDHHGYVLQRLSRSLTLTVARRKAGRLGSRGRLTPARAPTKTAPALRRENHRVNGRGAARLGVDIGGTFTDVALEQGERRWSAKILTTPEAPETAVLAAIGAVLADAGLAPADLSIIIHGTTL